jgi:hypothetical protein
MGPDVGPPVAMEVTVAFSPAKLPTLQLAGRVHIIAQFFARIALLPR